MFKGKTITGLTAQELDIIVQRLAVIRDLWGIGSSFREYTKFSVGCSRRTEVDQDRHIYVKVTYWIHFPRSTWKKIRMSLSDTETEAQLLGAYDDRSD